MADEVWAAGEYVVTADVVVPSDVTLTLEPGVVIRYRGGSLRVHGRLLAEGSAEKPISFTPEIANSSYSVRLDDSRESRLDHVRFSGSTAPVNVRQSNVTVSNAVFENYRDYAVYVWGNSVARTVRVTDSYFDGSYSSYGIYMVQDVAAIDVQRSTFVRNGYGLYLTGSGPVSLRSNTIQANSIGAYIIENYHYNRDSTIVSNTIARNGTGLHTQTFSVAKFVANGNNLIENTTAWATQAWAGTYQVPAADNWWGTSSAAEIDAMIADSAYNQIVFEPFRTSAATLAPLPDTQAPETTITAKPLANAATNSATFTFSTSEPAGRSRFECRMDSATWSACSSPTTYTNLTDGQHRFAVRAIDDLNNTDPTPTSWNWTSDTVVPPAPVITSPAGGGYSRSTSLNVSGTADAGASVEVFDGTTSLGVTSASGTGAWSVTVTLSEGLRTLRALARDPAGNLSGYSASHTVTVDTVAPAIPDLTAPAAGAFVGSSTVKIVGTAEAAAKIEIRDKGSLVGSTDATAGGAWSRELAGFVEGGHELTATATDAAGNTSAPTSVRNFTVDLTAPGTSITDGPEGATTSRDAAFEFHGTEEGARFECKLDSAAWTACASPHAYADLSDASHVFSVRAVDRAGNADPTEAVRAWKIDNVDPGTSLTSATTGLQGQGVAKFSFSSDESPVVYECRLNSSPWLTCESPRAYDDLADGSYTFAVRAVDAAGNDDATPASASFTIDTTAPAAPSFELPAENAWSRFSTVSLSGTAEPHSTVELFEGTSSRGTAVVGSSGTWSRQLTSVTDGSHSFIARATDLAGNTSLPSSARAIRVDTTPADTSIVTAPAGVTRISSPTFDFTSPEAGAAFECRLDGPGAVSGTWAHCQAPKLYSERADGAYVFRVRAIDEAGNVDATPATREFSIDASAPGSPAVTSPASNSWSRSSGFRLSGTAEPGATVEIFEGELSRGTTVASSGGTWGRDLVAADGTHAYAAVATDAAGNASERSTPHTIRVDTVAPDTTALSGPSGTTSEARPTFTFNSLDAAAAFECRLDGTAWFPCASPYQTGSLTQGTHSFSARAVDTAGNADPTEVSWSFAVQNSTPQTSIDQGPTGLTANASPSFAFSSDGGTQYECRLDGGSWTTCSSPKAYTNLGDGDHTFDVRARDAMNNVDPSPASRTFTVDTTAPPTSLDSGPSGSQIATTATFGFSSETGATFECKLAGEWAACTSPKAFADLAPGDYTFAVRARDLAGNVDVTPATRTFSVTTPDTADPETTLSDKPAGTTRDASPTFTFGSDDGVAFDCRVDDASWARCASPKQVGPLADGAHTFEVRAVDSSGNVDDSPASSSFTVDTTGPSVAITEGPPDPTTSRTVSFAFKSPDPEAQFECRLNQGSWQQCASPVQHQDLATGKHAFEVRARDAVGNYSVTAASRSFEVKPEAVASEPPATPVPPTVSTPPAATTPAPQPPFQPGADVIGPAVTFVMGQKARAVRGTVKVKLGTIGEPITGKIEIHSRNRIRVRGRRKILKLGTAAFSMDSAIDGNVVVKLSSDARRSLQRLRRIPITITMTATDGSGNAARRSHALTLVK